MPVKPEPSPIKLPLKVPPIKFVAVIVLKVALLAISAPLNCAVELLVKSVKPLKTGSCIREPALKFPLLVLIDTRVEPTVKYKSEPSYSNAPSTGTVVKDPASILILGYRESPFFT